MHKMKRGRGGPPKRKGQILTHKSAKSGVFQIIS
jgi:hypothetical protein